MTYYCDQLFQILKSSSQYFLCWFTICFILIFIIQKTLINHLEQLFFPHYSRS